MLVNGGARYMLNSGARDMLNGGARYMLNINNDNCAKYALRFL